MVCEICWSKAHHRHHIISKSLGGSNRADNIATLCASCHMDIHDGSIIIEGRFLTTSGLTLLWHKKGESSITGMEDSRVHIF
jgi:hypothetical protein